VRTRSTRLVGIETLADASAILEEVVFGRLDAYKRFMSKHTQPIRLTALAEWESDSDPARYLAARGIDYVARNVIIMVSRREITGQGALAVMEGSVVMFEEGDGPIAKRLIAALPATEVEVLSKPRIGLGSSLVLRVGDTTYKVMPEATHVGKTFGVLKAISRARASVAAFEEALHAAQT
jgi:hypothetical protein